MNGELLTLLTLGLLFLLMTTGIPLAFATGLTAVVLTLLTFGPDALYLIPSRIFTLMGNYSLIAVPLFAWRGLYATSVVYVVLLGLSIDGLLQWRRAAAGRPAVAA